MAVEAVVGYVQLAIGKPFVKRGIAFVQYFGKRLFPRNIVACQITPKAFVIGIGFFTQGIVRIHAVYIGVGFEFVVRFEYPIFFQYGFNGRHKVSPFIYSRLNILLLEAA